MSCFLFLHLIFLSFFFIFEIVFSFLTLIIVHRLLMLHWNPRISLGLSWLFFLLLPLVTIVNYRLSISGLAPLFILGLLFCFYIVLPFMFQFFIHALPSDIHMLPDIYHSLDFILRMLLIFGLCFQVPLICLLFLHIQWITIEQLKMIRPYIIVTAFILGMLLTPPDVFSQILLAIPLCLLYELGILLCYWQSIKLRTISEH